MDRRFKLGLQTNIGSNPSWLMKYYHAQALVTNVRYLGCIIIYKFIILFLQIVVEPKLAPSLESNPHPKEFPIVQIFTLKIE